MFESLIAPFDKNNRMDAQESSHSPDIVGLEILIKQA